MASTYSPGRMLSVWKKEIRDALRDRKALTTILITPLLNLVLVYGLVQFGVYIQRSSQDFVLPVVGMDNAAPLVDWLAEKDIHVRRAGEDAIQKVKDDQLDLVLVIPGEFPEQFADLDAAVIELVYNRSRKDVSGKINTLKTHLREWSLNIGTLRLLTRGVSPAIISPLSVQDSDVSKLKERSSPVLGVLALILTLTVFTTSMGISIDMMAGERERSSLEPLLLSPASRWSILLGKWATSMLFTFLVMLFVILAFYWLLPRLPLEELGVRGKLTLFDVTAVGLVSLPLILISTIFQLFVSIFSRSYKEAQSYIGLLMIVPIMVGYYVIWSDVSLPWQYYVPVMSTQMLMEDILSLGYSAWHNYLASVGVSLLLSLVLAAVTVKQLEREKIIYG